MKYILLTVLSIFLMSCGNSDFLGFGGSGETSCKYIDIDSSDGNIDIKETAMLNVPQINQYPNYCGPASLAMVLEYNGYSYSQKELGQMMDISPINGVTPDEIVKVAKSIGLSKSSVVSCDLGILLYSVDNDVPVIVRTYDDTLNAAHYMVVVGYDLDSKSIYVNDPAATSSDRSINGAKKLSFSSFEYLWNVNTLAANNNSYNLMILIK